MAESGDRWLGANVTQKFFGVGQVDQEIVSENGQVMIHVDFKERDIAAWVPESNVKRVAEKVTA